MPTVQDLDPAADIESQTTGCSPDRSVGDGRQEAANPRRARPHSEVSHQLSSPAPGSSSDRSC